MEFLFIYLIGCFAAYLLLRNVHEDNESTVMTYETYQNDNDEEMILGILFSWVTVIGLLVRNFK